MKTSVAISASSFALITVGAMLVYTRPGEVGPFGVLAFFILLYIFCSGVTYVSLVGFIRLLKSFLPSGALKRWAEDVSHIKIYYYTTVLALAPVVTLGMASVGTINGLDIALILLFEILACFYISRRF